MTEKQMDTAVILQMATPDGSVTQQFILIRGGAAFRRTLALGTRWRASKVDDLPNWISRYVELAATFPNPMHLDREPQLVAITDAEADEASRIGLPSSLEERAVAALDGATRVTTTSVRDFMVEWSARAEAEAEAEAEVAPATPDTFIVIQGNPVDGHAFHGPFDEHEDAVSWATDSVHEADWWVATLQDVER